MQHTLRIGTRQSPLALWQAEHVAGRLISQGFNVELVRITTAGDAWQGSLAQSGGSGLFTKEIQRALLDGRCDVAVHSLKDLPTEPVPGLALSAVPEREDPSDCLVARDAKPLRDLPPGARVGTGSPRRRAQISQYRPDLQLVDIRGNVDTRLKKLGAGDYDAIVLAVAGLRRLGLEHAITETLPLEIMIPAVGQAALGIETRVDDRSAIQAVQSLDHTPSHVAVACEREVLRQLQAGCLAPVAAHAYREQHHLVMRCRVFSSDFTRCIAADHAIRISDTDAPFPEQGRDLVQGIMDQLLRQNAAEWVAESRNR